MSIKKLYFFLTALVITIFVFVLRPHLRDHITGALQTIRGKKTVADRVNEYGSKVRERLLLYFCEAETPYPPEKIIFVGLKQERILEVWACGSDSKFKLVRTYPILAASGQLGPKLKEGDYQVPEGLYRIESLNPNSKFHLSLKLNYPNDFDLACAKRDGRSNLGGDIMIHGSNVSIGCLAMGDEAAEDLFVLAAQTGLDNICVILSPIDFRTAETPKLPHPLPPWTETLYEQIKQELLNLATNRKATSPMAPAKGL